MLLPEAYRYFCAALKHFEDIIAEFIFFIPAKYKMLRQTKKIGTAGLLPTIPIFLIIQYSS